MVAKTIKLCISFMLWYLGTVGIYTVYKTILIVLAAVV